VLGGFTWRREASAARAGTSRRLNPLTQDPGDQAHENHCVSEQETYYEEFGQHHVHERPPVSLDAGYFQRFFVILKRPSQNIALVGPGRAGKALGRLLREAGWDIAFVVARRRVAARAAARFIGGGRACTLDSQDWTGARIVLLTVSDSAIAPLAKDLAARDIDWNGGVVLHICGSLPVEVLQPLRERGASIGSWHPFQTVPSAETGVRNLRGTFWAIDGDRAAQVVAKKLAKSLDGTPFRVRSSERALYHLSAFLVSPTTVTLMEKAIGILHQAGVADKIARPMLTRFAQETVRNFIERGARGSLSGPAVRGDWATLHRHLAALRKHDPKLIPLYGQLVEAMMRFGGPKLPKSLRAAFHP
jgi:predicted short-subunit dehydrogenase-like oxidoreductase (DUF2520 family)